MTRDEIDKASGRALDALVDVEIFGKELIAGTEPPRLKGKRGYEYPFHYSAGWPGIGLVVGIMQERGWQFEFGSFIRDGDKCDALFWKKSRQYNGNATSNEPAVAVCRAALYALLAEREAKR